jgi:hypothetical protein
MTNLTNTALAFGKALYATATVAGRADIVGLSDLTGPELVKMFNELAFELGTPEVTRFSDTKAAIRRTWVQLQAYAAAKPETQVSADAPGKVETVGDEPKQERLKAGAEDAIKAKPTPAAAVKSKPGAGLPVASGDAHKDGQMPPLRRTLKPTNLKPKPTVYARKAGSKQALLVDLLARPEGATFGELFDAMASQGTPWQGTTVRAGLAWDINHVAGYGVASTAHDGEAFAEMGRTYEAERLGMVSRPGDNGGPVWSKGPHYDPDFKLLVYSLTYPGGAIGPVAHTPRPGPSASQKAAASAALNAALKNGGKV